ESSREAKPEAMANEDEEAGGSRKRKAADAPEGANADAQSDEDEMSDDALRRKLME
ncbi:unnamed protein product, partial [Symbiodinium pilosum]